MAEFRSSIEIAAPPATVFGYLVTEEGMTAWMGRRAALDARVGGAVAIDIAGYPVRGTFLAIEEPERIVMTWGFTGNDDLPPGASTVEFRLSPVPGGTRVDLRHSNLPDPEVPGHKAGWAHFLPRLATASTTGHAGPDGWRPGDATPM